MKSKILILLAIFLTFLVITKTEAECDLEFKSQDYNSSTYNLDYQELKYPRLSYSKEVKGIYINFWTLSHKEKREKMIERITESNLNAVVIDLKDTKGYAPFASSAVTQMPYNISKEEFEDLISQWQRNGIYVIGRIAIFKDSNLANVEDDYALKYLFDDKSKTVTISSERWTNPYVDEVWNYNLNIAEEMVELGLDEIQFDYIRFPTLSQKSRLTIKSDGVRSKSDAIIGFLKEAQKRLQDYNIVLSADLFGLTTTAKEDLGIGQDITKIAQYVDYISPMLYPSHYSQGIYGIENPARSPYQVISKSLADAKEKLGPDANKIRPWLQDFSLSYSYDKEEIKAQIRAVEDQKLSSWLLWNPSSRYTIEALIPNSEEEIHDGD
ncbi:MAG: putative glycoside hydrolase [Halanaerobacter sp.]